MNFQNSGYEVTGKVEEDCGRPRLHKRQVNFLSILYVKEMGAKKGPKIK